MGASGLNDSLSYLEAASNVDKWAESVLYLSRMSLEKRVLLAHCQVAGPQSWGQVWHTPDTLPHPSFSLLPHGLSPGLLLAFSPHLTYPIIFVSLLLSLPSFLSFSQIPSLLGQIHHYEYIHLHLPNILLFHEVFPAPSIRCKHFLLRTLTALWISLMPLIMFCHAVFLELLYCMPPRKRGYCLHLCAAFSRA